MSSFQKWWKKTGKTLDIKNVLEQTAENQQSSSKKEKEIIVID